MVPLVLNHGHMTIPRCLNHRFLGVPTWKDYVVHLGACTPEQEIGSPKQRTKNNMEHGCKFVRVPLLGGLTGNQTNKDHYFFGGVPENCRTFVGHDRSCSKSVASLTAEGIAGIWREMLGTARANFWPDPGVRNASKMYKASSRTLGHPPPHSYICPRGGSQKRHAYILSYNQCRRTEAKGKALQATLVHP